MVMVLFLSVVFCGGQIVRAVHLYRSRLLQFVVCIATDKYGILVPPSSRDGFLLKCPHTGDRHNVMEEYEDSESARPGE